METTSNSSLVGFGTVTVNAGGTLIGGSGALGVGYNTVAAPLTINGGLVIANYGGVPTSTGWTGLFAGALTMTGGTITGDLFNDNGPMTVNANATPSIVSLSNQFCLDDTGNRTTNMTVNSGGTLVFNCHVQDGYGTGSIDQLRDGTMVFNGSVNIGGWVVVNGGTMVINNAFTRRLCHGLRPQRPGDLFHQRPGDVGRLWQLYHDGRRRECVRRFVRHDRSGLRQQRHLDH